MIILLGWVFSGVGVSNGCIAAYFTGFMGTFTRWRGIFNMVPTGLAG